MKLILKYGGTSISSPKKIKDVAKFVVSQSKNNEVVTVCSAVSGTTDNLIEISNLIKKGNKEKAKEIVGKIIYDNNYI